MLTTIRNKAHIHLKLRYCIWEKSRLIGWRSVLGKIKGDQIDMDMAKWQDVRNCQYYLYVINLDIFTYNPDRTFSSIHV